MVPPRSNGIIGYVNDKDQSKGKGGWVVNDAAAHSPTIAGGADG